MTDFPIRSSCSNAGRGVIRMYWGVIRMYCFLLFWDFNRVTTALFFKSYATRVQAKRRQFCINVEYILIRLVSRLLLRWRTVPLHEPPQGGAVRLVRI